MKNNIVISKYMPYILNMHVDTKKSIFDYNIDVELTNVIDYPKCSFGFHHYIHSIKKDTEVLKQFENKKKVYLVTNEFEIDVDNYDNCIFKETIKFLNLKDNKPQILSLDFYKIWEILFMFELFNNDIPLKTFVIDDNGVSIQSILFFREKYAKNNKNDEYSVLKSEKINEEFYNYYNKSHNIYKNDKLKNDKLKSEKMDLIISGVNFKYEDDNIIEQIYFTTLFKNLLETLNIQKKNGSAIFKIFETFTNISIKIISILSELYEKVFVIKPHISKITTAEKFIVCIGFKYIDKDKEYTTAYKKIEDINNIINKNSKLRLCDIFKSYNIDNSYKARIIKLNTLITNIVFKGISENINFVNGQNYYGDKYQQYRDEQINANNYWVDTFIPYLSNFKETKKKIIENSIASNKINMDDAFKLEKILN